MVKAKKLKVFRTPIGFHDAYVAAPSRKAALAAWGSDADLFARGLAEVVTDAALSKEPLARPGEVIKRARGSAAEHFAALPKAKLKEVPPPKEASRPAKKASPAKPPPPKPRPSRAGLDAAEAALADLERRQDEEDERLRRREQELERERVALRKRHAADRERGQREVQRADEAYDRALSAWRAS